MQEEKVDVLDREKVEVIEKFYHKVRLRISDEWLADPTEINLSKIKKAVNVLDSHSYIIYPEWYQELSIEQIEGEIKRFEFMASIY